MEQSEHTHLSVKFTILDGCNLWHPKTMTIVISKITDHHNKYNNNEKVKFSQNYQNVTQSHEVTKCCWENGFDRLAQCRVATNLQFVKNTISAKHNKAKCDKKGMSEKKKKVCLYRLKDQHNLVLFTSQTSFPFTASLSFTVL